MSESYKGQTKVEIVSDYERFACLQQQWEDLHQAAGGGPFSSFDWISSWMDVYLTDAIDMRIVLVWDGEDLVVAIPLACETLKISDRLPFKTKTLRMLHDDRVGYHDILMRPDRAAEMAFAFNACAKDCGAAYMDLTPIKQSEGLSALVSTAKHKGVWTNTRDEIETAIADISGGLDAYMTRLSSGTRKKMRSLDRKLRKEGAEVHITGQAGANEDAILAAALDVSSRSWKAQGGTDIGSQSSDRAFFEALYSRLSPKGKIRVITTDLDGVAVSSIVDLVQGDTTYGLISDYDDSYHAKGVGRFAGEECIRIAISEGSAHYDMLRATHFTRSYCQTFEHYQRVRIALRTGKARWVFSAESLARQGIKSLRGNQSRLTGRRKILGDRTPKS